MGTPKLRIAPEPEGSGRRRRAPRRRLPHFLSEAQIVNLLAACDIEAALANTDHRLYLATRDRTMIAVCLYTGTRISELLKLELKDLDLIERRLFVWEGKYGVDRCLRVNAKLAPILEHWLTRRPDLEGGKRYLFPGPSGGLYSVNSIEQRFAMLGRRAKLEWPLTPHVLRHTFATRLLETGSDIREVQELLGHASMATTQVYLHTTTKKLIEAVERL